MDEFKELAASTEVDSYEGCGPRLSTVMGSLVQPSPPPIEDEAEIRKTRQVENATQSIEVLLLSGFSLPAAYPDVVSIRAVR